jgi:hypothetical protein
MSLIKYKILLIDHKIKGFNIILQSINNDVKIIIIDQLNTLISEIEHLKLGYIDCIGIIKDEEDYIIENYNFWYEFIKILKFAFHLQNIDFISCNLANNINYKYIFNKIEQNLNIIVGASTKILGNNNWILDRGNRNLIGIYFNELINIYPYSFGINFNLNITTISSVINHTSTVYLNIITNPIMTLNNNNNFWIRINTISGDLTISGVVNNYYIIDNLIAYTIGNNSLKLTLNGGIDWLSLQSPANSQLNNIFCWDISNILITGTNRIYKTLNGGLNWYDISGNYNLSTIICSGFINEFGVICCNNLSLIHISEPTRQP